MRNIIKRAGAIALAGVLTVGLGASTLAYSTTDFADVPANNWAYEPVMKMADAGIIKGSSTTTFAPEVKVSPAMWLTLVGRAVYEADVQAAAQTGDNWYAAYVRVAETKGLLTGTAIDQTAIEGEMTRYDMAATVYSAVKLLGAKDATVDTSGIKDYGMIPMMYGNAVAQVYGLGLIKGDNAGNFNGTATMTRAEAATVMDRLIDLRTKLHPTDPNTPSEDDTVTFAVKGQALSDGVPIEGARVQLRSLRGSFSLGTRVTSGADGWFTIEATVDTEDYSYTEPIYYTYGQYTLPDGTTYETAWAWGTVVHESLAKNQNNMTCNLIKPPAPPPRTGEMVDVEFSAAVSVMIGNKVTRGISGINIQFCTLDGRVLGTAVSEDGSYQISTSIDKADCSYSDKIYIMKATYTAPDGTKYSNLQKNPPPLNLDEAVNGSWPITLYDDPNRVDLDF